MATRQGGLEFLVSVLQNKKNNAIKSREMNLQLLKMKSDVNDNNIRRDMLRQQMDQRKKEFDRSGIQFDKTIEQEASRIEAMNNSNKSREADLKFKKLQQLQNISNSANTNFADERKRHNLAVEKFSEFNNSIASIDNLIRTSIVGEGVADGKGTGEFVLRDKSLSDLYTSLYKKDGPGVAGFGDDFASNFITEVQKNSSGGGRNNRANNTLNISNAIIATLARVYAGSSDSRTGPELKKLSMKYINGTITKGDTGRFIDMVKATVGSNKNGSFNVSPDFSSGGKGAFELLISSINASSLGRDLFSASSDRIRSSTFADATAKVVKDAAKRMAALREIRDSAFGDYTSSAGGPAVQSSVDRSTSTSSIKVGSSFSDATDKIMNTENSGSPGTENVTPAAELTSVSFNEVKRDLKSFGSFIEAHHKQLKVVNGDVKLGDVPITMGMLMGAEDEPSSLSHAPNSAFGLTRQSITRRTASHRMAALFRIAGRNKVADDSTGSSGSATPTTLSETPASGPAFDAGYKSNFSPNSKMREANNEIGRFNVLGDLISQIESSENFYAANRRKDGIYVSASIDRSSTFGSVKGDQTRGSIFAAGAFQYINNTLKSAQKALGIPDTAPFNEINQIRLFNYTLGNNKALMNYLETGEGLDKAVTSLSKIWAALPGNNGDSYYSGSAGNHAGVTIDQFKIILEELKNSKEWN